MAALVAAIAVHAVRIDHEVKFLPCLVHCIKKLESVLMVNIIVACSMVMLALQKFVVENVITQAAAKEGIVLDDAYQHRYVKAGMNILLCDYNRPIYKDKLLPLGRLREGWKSAIHRATHVIVTKCPDNLTPLDRRVVMTSLDMYPYQMELIY